jgi:hypothetical protein
MTALGLFLGFVGSVLLFADSWRISQCFSDEGVTLGWPHRYRSRFWRLCGRFGIGMVALGFLTSLIAYFAGS